MSTPDNRISLQKLEVFCKVVDLGGVRRAAEELYISQPVVSAHLRSLQERIGARLFERDGRGIALTEAGQEVHLWASEVLRGRLELQSSLHNLSSGMSGSAVVATSMSVGTYILTPVLIDFRRRYEKATLTLLVSGVEQALEASLTGRADVCVIATDAVLDTNAFEAELIAEPEFCIVAAADSALVGDRVRPSDLNGMPFVCPPGGQAIRRAQDNALASIGVMDRRVEIELGNAESIKKAIEANLGLGLLWRTSVEDELANGTLREVTLRGPALRDKLFLVTRRGKRSSPLQRRLLQAIREGAASRFAPDEVAPALD